MPTSRGAASDALNKSAIARYIQLASLFRRRIETGEWPVGNQIPTIDMLSSEFGVAVMTIRQALDTLEKEGLIERFRAKGTFVKRQPTHNLWCQVDTNWNGMLIAREDATIEVLSDTREVQLPPRDYRTGVPGTSYRHLQRRHARDGEAFLLADVYVAEKLVSHIAEADYHTKTALRLVADVPGLTITQATQTLTIDIADLEVSQLLDIPVSAPVALVTRCAIDEAGELVLVAHGTYRGDRVRIDFNLR